MGKINHARTIGNIPYTSSGDLKSLDLPLNNVYRALLLRLTASFVVGTASTVVKYGAPWGLVKKLEIVANGQNVIKAIPGWKLYAASRLNFGTPPGGTYMASPLTAGPFYAEGALLFNMPHSRVPVDTALDARGLSTLGLNVTWGGIPDLYGTVGTSSVSAASLKVSGLEHLNVPADYKPAIYRENWIRQSVAATSSELMVRLPTNVIYRRFLIVTMRDDVLASNIINKVALRSGTFTFQNWDQEMLALQNKLWTGLEQIDSGVYLLDLVSDGMLSEQIDTTSYSSIELVFDVTKTSGVEEIHILPDTTV